MRRSIRKAPLPRLALPLAVCVAAAVLVLGHARAAPPVGGAKTARAWNATTIAAAAHAIPIPRTPATGAVEVPRWNRWLRHALMGNQNPHKRAYRPTYVRCWSPSVWDPAAQKLGVMGFYRRGSAWVNVRVSTCINAAKGARGELSQTTVVALGTILHETFHRQGVRREADATCLAATGVWQAVNRYAGPARADRARRQVIGWYRAHLTGTYRRGLDGCAGRSAVAWNDARVWR